MTEQQPTVNGQGSSPPTLADLVCPLLSRDLTRLAERFALAERQARQAAVLGERGQRDAAEAERDTAAAAYFELGAAAGELLLFLLRQAQQYQRDALRLYLADALREELDEIREAVARLENTR
jgi:hypothetical protein